MIGGADEAYDTADFVADCRAIKVTSHVAQNTKNRCAPQILDQASAGASEYS
jgi:hypothetical protein